MFRCTALSATLSVTGCAKRWREAAVKPVVRPEDAAWRPDPFSSCRGCSIGAAHAGAAAVTYSALFGSSICPRCRKGVTRFIGGKVCVSCYNRAREVAAGLNARGRAPTKIRPLSPVRVRASVNGQPIIIEDAAAVDIFEPTIQALRTMPGPILFSWAAPKLIRSPYHRAASPARRPPRYQPVPKLSDQGMLF